MNPIENNPNESGPRIVGKLASGEDVYFDTESHVHYEDVIYELMGEAVSKIDSQNRDYFIESVDLGRIVGASNCVETTDEDEIVYVHRPNRRGETRFVKNREPEPTKFVTAVLLKKERGYKVVTAYIGPKAEREPWDRGIRTPEEQEISNKFWANHALVWGRE